MIKARTDVDQMVTEEREIVDVQLRSSIEDSRQAIAESTAATEKTRQEFDVFVQSTKEAFREDLSSIQVELATLKKVNEIRAMRADAIAGEAAFLDKLRELKSSSDPLVVIEATAAVLDISGAIYSMRQGDLARFGRNTVDGSWVKDEDYSTSMLLEILANNENWTFRARAAGLLGKRKEIKVRNHSSSLFPAMRTSGFVERR